MSSGAAWPNGSIDRNVDDSMVVQDFRLTHGKFPENA